MGAPLIGYENFFSTGVVSATGGSVAGNEIANAYSGTTYDYWSPLTLTGTHTITVDLGSPADVTYFALTAATWDSAVPFTVNLQYSNDNFSGDINDATANTIIPDRSPFMESFSVINSRYWRIRFIPSGVPTVSLKVAAASVGPQFDLLRAYSVGSSIPTDSITDKIINQVSNGGEFLGRSVIRQAVSAEIMVTFRDIAFHRGVWRTFIEAALTQPFWFSWNADFPDDVIYAWMVGNPSPPTWDTNRTLSAGLTVAGLRN